MDHAQTISANNATKDTILLAQYVLNAQLDAKLALMPKLAKYVIKDIQNNIKHKMELEYIQIIYAYNVILLVLLV